MQNMVLSRTNCEPLEDEDIQRVNKKRRYFSSEGEENRKNRSAKNSGGRMRNARRVGMRVCAPNTSFGM